MKNRYILLLALALVFTGCGGQENGPAKTPPPPAGGGTGPIAAHIPPEGLLLKTEEWLYSAPGRLSGLSGRALDEDGVPLKGATATVLIPPPYPVASAVEDRVIEADAQGQFRIDDVPTNAWVRVVAPGYGGINLPAQVLLRTGFEPFDVRLPLSGKVRGTVRFDTGEPLVGVLVLVSNRDPRFETTVRTDEEGRYVANEVTPGVLAAWIVDDVYQGNGEPVRLESGGTAVCDITVTRPAPLTLKLVDSQTGRPLAGALATVLLSRESVIVADENGEIRIDGASFPRVWIRGRGYAEIPFEITRLRDVAATETIPVPRGAWIHGRVVDEDGNPMAGARVRVMPRADEPAIPVRGPLTAEDGTFEVSWVPAATEPVDGVVFAEAAGYHLARPAPCRIDLATEAVGAEVVLRKNQSVSCRVLLPDGTPLPGAVVGVRGLEPIRAGKYVTFNSGSSGATDEDGRVTLSGLAPQSLELTVRARNRAGYRRVIEVEPGGALEIGEIRLSAGLPIAGRIISTSGRIPDGMALMISGRDVRADADIRPDGSFRCEGLPEGPLDIRVVGPGHEPLLVQRAAGDEGIELIVRAVSSLDIGIERPDEAPISGWIELKPTGGQAREQSPVVRQLEGKVDSYGFRNLLAGPYRVRIQAGDYYALLNIDVEHGKDVRRKVVLERGATIRGVLSLPDGSVAGNTGVILHAGEEWGNLSAVTRTDGSFDFRGVPPGKLTLRVHPTGYAATTKTVEAASGEEVEVALELRRGARIEIKVRDGEGRALADVGVSLGRPDGTPARFWVEGGGRARTDAEGKVALIGLEAGDYDLSLFRGETRHRWGKVSVEENGSAEVEAVFEQ